MTKTYLKNSCQSVHRQQLDGKREEEYEVSDDLGGCVLNLLLEVIALPSLEATKYNFFKVLIGLLQLR